MAEEIDIGTELYEEVKKSFESKYNNHYMIQDILKKIKSGKARFEDTATYSRCVGNALANAIIENVTQDKLPIGQMYYNIADKILRPTLKNNYELINAAAASVQEKLDKNANLRIKAQKAEFPSERVNSIVNAASEKGAAWETVQRRMTSPVENITESFYNDYIQTNAEFRSKAGLDVYIVRDDHSGCCEWCAKLAGKCTGRYLPPS